MQSISLREHIKIITFKVTKIQFLTKVFAILALHVLSICIGLKNRHHRMGRGSQWSLNGVNYSMKVKFTLMKRGIHVLSIDITLINMG